MTNFYIDVDNLLPCPFCGSPATYDVDEDDLGHPGRVTWVGCEECEDLGFYGVSAHRWNIRTPSPDTRGETDE